MVWRTDNNLVAPGWITGHESVVSLTGGGNVFKVVGAMSQFNNLLTGGTATNVLGYEAVVSYMDPASHVTNYSGFYVPNVSVVPNIGNISNFSAFQSDYTEAKNSFLHPTYGGARQDLSPGARMKMLPGLYHSSSFAAIAPTTLPINTLGMCPIYVNDRTTFTRVGFTVTTAVASSSCEVALYYGSGLLAFTQVADFGTISTTTTGDKEITINQRLDSGITSLS